MFDLLLSSLILSADVSQPQSNNTSNACAGHDVGEQSYDIDGVCVYYLDRHGWYYIKNGQVHGAEGSLKDKWGPGFSTKEKASEASKK